MLKRIKSNKALRFLSSLIISLFIILIVRITYAFLAPEIQDGLKDVNLKSDTVDKLTFISGDPLNINATPTTLPENGENLVSVSRPRVSLIANSTVVDATYTYSVYIEISNNTFEYSKNNTPEILLEITNPNGNKITSSLSNNVSYETTSDGTTGFDITTFNGTINIGSFEITSKDSVNATIQEWVFTLIYLNQDYDQSINFGNSLNTKIVMQKV